MAWSYILKPNLKLNHLSFEQPPIRLFSPIKLVTDSARSIPFSSRLILNPISINSMKYPVSEFSKEEISRNPYDIVFVEKECLETGSTKLKEPVALELAETTTFTNNPCEIVAKYLLKSLRDPLIAMVLLVVVALFYSPNSSLAASGGVMGGSSSSSHSSSSCSSSCSSCSDEEWDDLAAIFYVIFVYFYLPIGLIVSATGKITVIKLQVGMMGSARSLQEEFNRIAKSADTSKKEGMIYILNKTTIAMLQHLDYCISGYSSVEVMKCGDWEVWNQYFREISNEERGKFDKETLVNVDNFKSESKITKEFIGLNNEYIVVTILVAAFGVYEPPAISSHDNLKQYLEMLGSITLCDHIMKVEVLWTPQAENDILTEKEFLEKYPLLQSLQVDTKTL